MRSFAISLVSLLLLLTTFVDAQIFTVNCELLTVQRSDPIVSPGVVSAHVHTVIGGTNFKRTVSNQDAINSNSTTCDKLLDNSNYWIPQLYHENRNGTYSLVPSDGRVRITSCGMAAEGCQDD